MPSIADSLAMSCQTSITLMHSTRCVMYMHIQCGHAATSSGKPCTAALASTRYCNNKLKTTGIGMEFIHQFFYCKSAQLNS